MEELILSNLENPGILEKLYRSDRNTFKKAFRSVYPENRENIVLKYWDERLSSHADELSWGPVKDLYFVFFLCLAAGLIAKFPFIFGMNEESFYSKNISFIVFPALTAFFAWKNELRGRKLLFIALSFVAGLFYINLIPVHGKSDTGILACIHLVLVSWSLTGIAFAGRNYNDLDKSLEFLKYNGELAVMLALMLISGGIMTGMTIGLFSLIKVDIERFYFDYVVILGLAAAPIVGTYLIRSNPQLVAKVSPLIARIFSPIVLIMLVSYLVAIVYSGKDPYNDREFLLIFNALLVGVMAIIFFSVSELSSNSNRIEFRILFALSLVTVIINCIALSAIVFRISEWGLTPNRAAVMGSNVLMIFNLLMVCKKLFSVQNSKCEAVEVGRVIARFLPVYMAWAAAVTFLFPVLFGFR